jgi:uncharacterized protein (TIGR01777 family)
LFGEILKSFVVAEPPAKNPGGFPPRHSTARDIRGLFSGLREQRSLHPLPFVNTADVRQRILIAGASGLIGRALVTFLRGKNCEVTRLVRRPAERDDELFWNPATGALDLTRLEGVHGIVNLSGENVGAGRWTAGRRERILRSRIDATRTLVIALAKLKSKPVVFVSASAAGFYGNRGDEALTEASGIGHGFLSEVCLAWETHAEGAARLGIRTVLMRFGVVLSPAGGALAKMLPAFRAGVGGRFGSGNQWMSWISLDDAVGAIWHVLNDAVCSGPINVTAPQPVTNAEFAAILGKVLGRPAILRVPAAILRFVFGRMVEETILASARALPARLQERGYAFRQPGLETALRHELHRGEKV